MIAVPVLGDNPCPRNGLNPPGSQYSPCDDNQQVMPDAANAPDFWRSFAATFKNDHSMAFELFNEPHPEAVRPDINVLGCWRNKCEIPGEGWQAAGMQQLIDAIRSAGATQPILVPGTNYSAVLYRPAGQGLTTPVGWLTPGVRPEDTLNPPQLAAANHMYDNSYDSTDLGCPHGNTPDCWDYRLGIIAAQVPLVTTELGEHDCDRSAKFINSYMNWADTKPASGRNRVSYLAWTFNADYSCNDVNTTLITNRSGTPTWLDWHYAPSWPRTTADSEPVLRGCRSDLAWPGPHLICRRRQVNLNLARLLILLIPYLVLTRRFTTPLA